MRLRFVARCELFECKRRFEMIFQWSKRFPLRNALQLTRAFADSSRALVFIKRTPVSSEKVTQASKENNRTNSLKVLAKVNRRKKDTTDETKKSNIVVLDVHDAMDSFQRAHPNLTSMSQLKVDPELIDVFLFTRDRPEVIIPSVEILYQSSEGHGFGIIPTSFYGSPFAINKEGLANLFTVVQVPKTVVGDKVMVKLLVHNELYCESALIKVVEPSKKRNDDLVVCKIFNECSGCQFQMIPYEDQMEYKKNLVKRAYKYFYPSLLDENPNLLNVGEVIESSLKYGYRNKLTPHYKIPKRYNGEGFPIGFDHPDPTKQITDLPHCDITSKIINDSLEKFKQNHLYKASKLNSVSRSKTGGLTIRETLINDPITNTQKIIPIEGGNQLVTVKVEDKLFQFDIAGFFQVNTQVLPKLLNVIRKYMKGHELKYLVDTYCGSGLFGICLSGDIPANGRVFGIEIDNNAVNAARSNARLNRVSNVEFIAGSADLMFESHEFLSSGIVGSESIVIMDPSRKGSSNLFLKQLIEFKPKVIAYVSCNVFTQARDLAIFDKLQKVYGIKYEVKEILGIDFFPQTRHVETIAIMELKE